MRTDPEAEAMAKECAARAANTVGQVSHAWHEAAEAWARTPRMTQDNRAEAVRLWNAAEARHKQALQAEMAAFTRSR